MKEYNDLLKLIMNYLNKSEKSAENFCNNYMEMFYSYSDILQKKISNATYEILDDINLICDSYETNESIRDKYCIDESELREKILKRVALLKSA